MLWVSRMTGKTKQEGAREAIRRETGRGAVGKLEALDCFWCSPRLPRLCAAQCEGPRHDPLLRSDTRKAYFGMQGDRRGLTENTQYAG